MKNSDQDFSTIKKKNKKKCNRILFSSLFIAVISVVLIFAFNLYSFILFKIIGVGLITGVGLIGYFWLKQKNIEIEFRNIQIQGKSRFSIFANYLGDIEDEILNLRVRFKHGGELFDRVSVLKNYFTKRYAFTSYYITELQKWHNAEFCDLEDSDFKHPAFVKELANKKHIDGYYNEVESDLIQKWPNLSSLLSKKLNALKENPEHLEFETSISQVKMEILIAIREIIKQLKNFDIQEYLLGKGTYNWLPKVETEIGDFVSVGNKISSPFIHMKASCIKMPQISSCILRRNGKHTVNFDDKINNSSAVNTWQMLNNDSLHKVSFIKIEYNINPADTVSAGVT